MGVPFKLIDDAVMAVLRDDATLQKYQRFNTTPPPWGVAMEAEGREKPYIIFQQISAIPRSTLGKRGWTVDMMVKVVSQSRWPKEGTAIASEIDDAMEGASLTVTGYSAYNVEWVSGIRYAEQIVAGRTYQHVGAIYQVWLEAA